MTDRNNKWAPYAMIRGLIECGGLSVVMQAPLTMEDERAFVVAAVKLRGSASVSPAAVPKDGDPTPHVLEIEALGRTVRLYFYRADEAKEKAQ